MEFVHFEISVNRLPKIEPHEFLVWIFQFEIRPS